MYSKVFSSLATGFALLSSAYAAYDPNGSNNVAMYWGQASAGSQQSLGDYCSQTAGDIYIISFIDSFGTSPMNLNVAGACSTTFSGSTLLTCPSIGDDIKSCQAAGKLVLLSLGGASGSYGFTSDSQAQDFAQTLWNTFGGGTTAERPFGDAQVDGFDLDIEDNNQVGYVALVNELRSLYSGASKQYYISTAPQCVYPDASVGDVLSSCEVDFAMIQFYNNPCAVDKSFNWDTGTTLLKTLHQIRISKCFWVFQVLLLLLEVVILIHLQFNQRLAKSLQVLTLEVS